MKGVTRPPERTRPQWIFSVTVVHSLCVSNYGDEQHLAEVAKMERQDRKIRIRVLDTAVAIDRR